MNHRHGIACTHDIPHMREQPSPQRTTWMRAGKILGAKTARVEQRYCQSVTQRQGRYVIPVRAEYKGSIDGIVHDQSASGATLFIGPLRVVQQNNAVRELELAEEKEVRRILSELSEAVAEESVYLRRNTQILAELDFTFAKARYAYVLDATMPEVEAFQPTKRAPRHKEDEEATLSPHPGSVINLRRARHPRCVPHRHHLPARRRHRGGQHRLVRRLWLLRAGLPL